MILVALAAASLAIAQDDEQARRAKTIEALQAAGINAATAMICPLVGYTTNEQAGADYIASEVGFAKEAGLYEEAAYDYANNGMKGQSAADLGRMKRLTQLVEAGDPAGKAGMAAMIDDVVDRCDLLASRSETRALFSYTPLNAQVAKRLAMKKMGLAK